MALLTANPNFRSIARQELTSSQLILLSDGFSHLANISKGPKGLDALTLMSTCPTHRHTYNACAFEVDQWLRGGESDFDIFLSSIEQIHPERLSYQPTLFEDMEDILGSIGKLLSGLNPNLEHCMNFCLTVLSEYRHKYEIFHENYEELLQNAKRSCQKTLQGKRFWELQIENRQIMDSSLEPDIVHRFNYLNLVESLAWYLTCYTGAILQKLGLLPVKHEERESSEKKLADFAKAYNSRLMDSANICGIRIQTSIPDELINPHEADWRNWWENFVKHIRKCFHEIRNFFDFYVYRFSDNLLEPFLPAKRGCVTLTGCREEILHNAFVLFFDIIRSKVTAPKVKDAFTLQIRQTSSEVISPAKLTEASDDAFVVVTKEWEACIDAARGCHSRAQGYPHDPSGFGGIRMTLEVGALMIITKPDEQLLTPRDSDAYPVITKAAYLADGIKKHLIEDREFANRIIVSSEAKAMLIRLGKIEDNKFKPVGLVEGKDGYSTQAFYFDVLPEMDKMSQVPLVAPFSPALP